MVHDKIAVLLKDLATLRDKLKEVKKDMKSEEKIETEDYLSLKKSLADLKKQVKDFEDDYNESLKKDSFYNQLREMKLKAEEEIALANEKLFALVEELPQKFFEMDVDLEAGRVKVQIQPEMRVYLNGKEEKKRA
ncbi:hypothetical protein KA119_01865 [Candidatus Gracilibacteria bacterium]|nr:hypothetical protein [Candidatus Gracilibacteria bacterium]